MLRPFLNHKPNCHSTCYIDPTALIIGQCTIDASSSIWPYAVLRGDVQTIQIGHHTNIQDGTVIHCASAVLTPPAGIPCIVGNHVTVGHKATLHACTIKDHCLIGMDSVVMDASIIEENVILGAKSLVPQGMVLRSGYLYLGSPAKAIRPLTDAEVEYIHLSATHYMELAQASYT